MDILTDQDKERLRISAQKCEADRKVIQDLCSAFLQKKKAGLSEGVGILEFNAAFVSRVDQFVVNLSIL